MENFTEESYGKVTVEWIIIKVRELNSQIKDLESALIKLRGGNDKDGLKGIESDERLSVKILYGQYTELMESYNQFTHQIVQFEDASYPSKLYRG
jgi:hypothetical protein